DGGVIQHHLRKLPLLLPHRGEADVLGGDGLATHSAGVLLREEAFGNDFEEVDVEDSAADGNAEGDPLVAQNPAQGSVGFMVDALESILEDAIKTAVAALVAGFQESRAEHRSGSERDEKRDGDGDAESDREFAEELADDSAHEKDGDEDRDERSAHGEHGEAD